MRWWLLFDWLAFWGPRFNGDSPELEVDSYFVWRRLDSTRLFINYKFTSSSEIVWLIYWAVSRGAFLVLLGYTRVVWLFHFLMNIICKLPGGNRSVPEYFIQFANFLSEKNPLTPPLIPAYKTENLELYRDHSNILHHEYSNFIPKYMRSRPQNTII